MSGAFSSSSRLLPWLLRAVVVAGASAVLLIDQYHSVRPAATGIPFWAFPFILLIVYAGPAALVLLGVEIVMTLKGRVKVMPLLLDAGLVAAWLALWWSHL
jgi:hypothetical protein